MSVITKVSNLHAHYVECVNTVSLIRVYILRQMKVWADSLFISVKK